MKPPETPKQASPRGPKANPEIAKITKQLGCTKRRAQQMVREASLASPGAAQDYLRLRCERIRQQVEKAELELAKLRAGDEGGRIGLFELKRALNLFVIYAGIYSRRRAEEIAHLCVGEDENQILKRLQALADCSVYSGTGAALENVSPTFVRVWEEALSDGDHRHKGGPGTAETCRAFALETARHILGTETRP